MWLPFASTEKRDSVFADLAASDKPRLAIALYGLVSIGFIVLLGGMWMLLAHFLKTTYGVELRSTLSFSSANGLTTPTLAGGLAVIVWIVVWIAGMSHIRRLSLAFGKKTGFEA